MYGRLSRFCDALPQFVHRGNRAPGNLSTVRCMGLVVSSAGLGNASRPNFGTRQAIDAPNSDVLQVAPHWGTVSWQVMTVGFSN